jgi:hypothetical protein
MNQRPAPYLGVTVPISQFLNVLRPTSATPSTTAGVIDEMLENLTEAIPVTLLNIVTKPLTPDPPLGRGVPKAG